MSTKYTQKVENKAKVVARLLGVKDKSPNLFSPSKSSSKSSSKSPGLGLPKDVREIIATKYKKMLPNGYRLRSWIPEERLIWHALSQNPRAIEMIEERIKFDKTLSDTEYKRLYYDHNDLRFIPPGHYNTVYWSMLSTNSGAIELIRNKIKEESSLTVEALGKLRENDRLHWSGIVNNTNPEAMKLLGNKRPEIEWFLLSGQKNAMSYITKKYEEEKLIQPNILFNMHGTEKLDWEELSYNSNAIQLIKEHLAFEETIPWNIFRHLNSANKISWSGLAKNINAMSILKKYIADHKEHARELDFDNPNYRYSLALSTIWGHLSRNPSAPKYLYENYPEKISWQFFSENPKAIKYVKMRIEEEKRLDLDNEWNKIDWRLLSGNHAAADILLLAENKEKINWELLSSNTNPKVIKLIQQKVEEEGKLSRVDYDLLRSHEKICWDSLLENPIIFEEK